MKSSGSLRNNHLKEVFDAVEEACKQLNIDFFVIGALARDIWYAKEVRSSRATKDIDFAVYVGDEEQFQNLKAYLKDYKGFVDSKNNSFVMISANGTQVDILPFGGIEIDSDVWVKGEGLTNIRVNGFMEVYNDGTKSIELETGHSFSVASLESIVLLKFISFDDRPEHRAKDPGDIADIILNYFSISADMIYDNYAHLFEEEKSLEQLSAEVIGIKIGEICGTNPQLHKRLLNIIDKHIQLVEKSNFVRAMCINEQLSIDQAVDLLSTIKNQL